MSSFFMKETDFSHKYASIVRNVSKCYTLCALYAYRYGESDMTKFKYDKKELKLIEESCIPMAVYQFIDKRVVTVAISKAAAEMFNCASLEEAYDLMDNNMYRDVHPDDIARISDEALSFATEDGIYDTHYRTKGPEGYYILHAIGKHIYKEGGIRLAVIQYINEGLYHESTNKNTLFSITIDKRLNYDHLTGFPKMDYFFEMSEAFHQNCLEENIDHVMIFFDFCGIKDFNQKYGYAEGDMVIRETAKLLSTYFGSDHCCRTTADHFAVYTYLKDIEIKLKNIFKDVKNISDKKVPPLRVGIYDARISAAASNPNATLACDRAKIACDLCGDITESTYKFYDVKMLKQFEDRLYVLDNIDLAIEKEWIEVHYQPMVRTSNGKVCTEEALARWMDPTKGFIPPLSFIPILEDYKISYKLDLYVVEQVCKKLNAQRDYGMFVVPNTINLSRTDFYICDMVEEIKNRVDAAGIDHSLIIIEITESILIDDLDYMKIQIDRFHKEGFTVWMDDFGSGYSSPSILQEIPFDAVKIDKLFIDNITTNENSRILVNEFVRLFSGLQCESIAEGVETIEQVNFLKEIGCSQLQGYYYHKPVPYSVLCELFDKKDPLTYENPDETDYYSKVGTVNLYDVSNASLGSLDGMHHYFDAIPMFIGEAGEHELRLIRGNKSFRDFMNHYYPKLYSLGVLPYSSTMDIGYEFTSAIQSCKENGNQIIVDVQTERGAIIHIFIRRIATNPKTNAVALAIVILGYVENNAELTQKQELELIRHERKAYRRITALSGDYICLYTVDVDTDHYVEFSATRDFQKFSLPLEGEDFFNQTLKYATNTVFIEDQDLFHSMFSKQKVLTDIKEKGLYSLNYRLIVNGTPKHVSLKAALIEEENGQELIVGILDTDAQVKKDIEYNKKLMAARDIANIDPLTGLKNKHAYVDLEAHLDKMIDEKSVPDFAIIVFDINDLKEINDMRGHQAGDQYIIDGSRRICNAFKHSPVFRVGGDEFVAIAQGDDYKNADTLLKKFQETNLKNVGTGAVVIASGMKKRRDEKSVAAVFEKADKQMYLNKRHLKELHTR